MLMCCYSIYDYKEEIWLKKQSRLQKLISNNRILTKRLYCICMWVILFHTTPITFKRAIHCCSYLFIIQFGSSFSRSLNIGLKKSEMCPCQLHTKFSIVREMYPWFTCLFFFLSSKSLSLWNLKFKGQVCRGQFKCRGHVKCLTYNCVLLELMVNNFFLDSPDFLQDLSKQDVSMLI